LVTEYHLAAVGVRTVNLRVDRIDTSAAIMKDANAAQPQVAAAAPTPLQAVKPAQVLNGAFNQASDGAAALRLDGHIERRGDITVQGGWLGSPNSVQRLEGFTIHWPNKPEGVDLAYSCQVQGARQPAALSGNYIGTRRRAAPITAVTFGLIGPKQKSFQLDGQVVFSGTPPKTIQNGQEISGPTGQEHLVAILVSVSPKLEANAPRYTSPWEDPAITQIYRAQG